MSDVISCRRRELHRKKAAQFLREGRRAEAKECLQRCVDITPQMALELMNVRLLFCLLQKFYPSYVICDSVLFSRAWVP